MGATEEAEKMFAELRAENERLRARLEAAEANAMAQARVASTARQAVAEVVLERDAERRRKDAALARAEALADSIRAFNHWIGWNITDACAGEAGCWCDAHKHARREGPALDLYGLRRDFAEETSLREKLAGILTATANGFRGVPAPPVLAWDWSDLPARAVAARRALEVIDAMAKSARHVFDGLGVDGLFEICSVIAEQTEGSRQP